MSGRLVVLVVGGAALALCIGSVAAKPTPPAPPASPKLTKGVTLEGVDPAFGRQLSPRPLTAGERVGLKNADQVVGAPKFNNIKKLDAVARARILGAEDGADLPDSLMFDAQNLYHNDATWMAVGQGAGGATVRPLVDLISFEGTEDPSGTHRADAVIHVPTEAGTRYLLECVVEAAAGETVTFTARGPSGEFSTTSDERVSLLLVHDSGERGAVNFELRASARPWHLDGCELSSYRR
jgi:hypothetical protein